MRYHRSTAISFTLVLLCGVAAQSPSWTAPPKLVVGIVVDQMRADYLYRYWDNFGEGGFKRLVGEGSFQRDAHYDYGPTHTGPGHASIYTGTTPRDHGIALNDMYMRATGRMMNCVQDDSVRGVGVGGPRSARSPRNLWAGTIADELELRTGRRSRTVGVAFKDRGAILPLGRMGDAAYWFFEDSLGRFATSTWYMQALPDWLTSFNERGLVAHELSGTWKPLLPLERYHQVMPDDNRYEARLPGTTAPKLPVPLAEAFAASGRNMELMKLIPGALTITTELALAALEGEGMGTDAITDLLAISYSATDEIGHEMGVRALETEDMYLRLDRELARLLSGLDKLVGAGEYTVFLTADHAAVDVPAYLQAEGAAAGYVEMAPLVAAVEKAASARFGAGPWVRRRVKEQLYLNDSLVVARGVDRAALEQVVAEAVRSFPGVAEAFTSADLALPALSSARYAMLQRGHVRGRSGDVCFMLRPGHLPAWPGMLRQGTEHGSTWNYDTHVPVLFFGKGVRPGEVLERTAITDIAPTVCALVGMAPPNASIGRIVPAVLQGR